MILGATSAFAATLPSDDNKSVIAEVQFNDGFMHKGLVGNLDISRFNKGNVTPPGQYRAELFVNEMWLGRTDVSMRQFGEDEVNVLPCMNRGLLERIGVDFTTLDVEALSALTSGDCLALQDLIPNATAQFDHGEQRLNITVPQAALLRNPRGYIDPRFWDDGVYAAKLQYNANVYHAESVGSRYSQSYVGVNGGMNIGPWRFNHMGSYSQAHGTGGRYQAMQTNLKRAITPLKSQLTLGDGFTDGQLFDAVGFRGVQLASDDRMYPESLRGFAPTVRGIASTTARVQIRQNGNIIYETTVQPGAFEINDLYATGYGGDLEVVVTEADGSVHASKVPYAAAVNALRPGRTRYSVTGGWYRSTETDGNPFLIQATVQHGFSNLFTGYAGATLAEDYTAGLVGVAMNTDLGALGADVTHARTQLAHQPGRSGQSYRISYTKLVAPTSTNLTLAAYRYSTQGYLGLADAMALRDLDARHVAHGMGGIQRGRVQITLNQALPRDWGRFFVAGSTQHYWNRNGRDTQFTLGYSNAYRRISYGVVASRELDVSRNRWVNRVMLTAGIPLGTRAHAPQSVTSIERISSGGTNLRESVSGTLGEDNRVSYALNAAHSTGEGHPTTTSVGASATYVSPFTTVNASVSKGTNYTQSSVGIAGGVVGYSGGIVLTPIMGETMTIVEAKDAGGAKVLTAAGLRLDPWGRAVAANMIPFARNQIEIDPKGLPLSVGMRSTTTLTSPTAGAVTVARFETEDLGAVVLIRAKLTDGKPLPFGATVLDAGGQRIGVVSQGSKILANLPNGAADLIVKWGDDTASMCALSLNLPAAAPLSDATGYQEANAVCARDS
ncbi:fimbrial biogenesis outer membrane usher protein [Cupriavidus pauculus]|uniref:Fimbrial biogenesis outer membrane usher protein n=2 Tax=Cupriavidus pauculus TaxID=82633 RepID=A0A2N5CE63_9BURK|nr:fimbrial biogenesis outer membrane usher protein [Cupriavidus pauculus]